MGVLDQCVVLCRFHSVLALYSKSSPIKMLLEASIQIKRAYGFFVAIRSFLVFLSSLRES